MGDKSAGNLCSHSGLAGGDFSGSCMRARWRGSGSFHIAALWPSPPFASLEATVLHQPHDNGLRLLAQVVSYHGEEARLSAALAVFGHAFEGSCVINISRRSILAICAGDVAGMDQQPQAPCCGCAAQAVASACCSSHRPNTSIPLGATYRSDCTTRATSR